MPHIKHVVEVNYKPTFRTEKVAGMFDVAVSDKLRMQWDIDLPIEDKPWQIGLIVGASGTGKTTIAKQAFGDCVHSGFEWKSSCLLDDFHDGCDTKLITETLSKVGFSSPPQWLLPYSVLSNGQKFRVDLARCLIEYNGLFVFDEFTSVVDRQVAKISAFAFQKAVRKSDRQFVAVTCHDDVEEWLQPDWVLDMTTGNFKWGCLRRPELKIEIYRCDYKAWKLFKGYHYLSADINKACRVYIAEIEGKPICLGAALQFPHPKVKNMFRGHRTVVLPDYQGIGIGNIMQEFIGDTLLSEGKRYGTTTSHPARINHMMKSPRWMLKKSPQIHAGPGNFCIGRNNAVRHRMTASFEYLG